MQVVDVLATARLVRLAQHDRPARPLRRWVTRFAYAGRAGDQAWPMPADPEVWPDFDAHEPPALVELLRCPWCLSVWVGAGVVAARALCPRVWDPIARALAASEVTGLIEQAVAARS